MEALPASTFEVAEAEFLLELLVVALDAPAQLGERDQAMSWGRVESQYFVGSFSAFGHSTSNHSCSPVAPRRAARTRTRAKREESRPLEPSRHVTVRQASTGKL